MAKDPEYAERFEQARAETTDELEFALRSIALSTDHRPSAVRALQILLRANCPERFGDKVSVEAQNSSPVVTSIEYVIVDPAAELPRCYAPLSEPNGIAQDAHGSSAAGYLRRKAPGRALNTGAGE